jgi:signal transduction histidine kinase
MSSRARDEGREGQAGPSGADGRNAESGRNAQNGRRTRRIFRRIDVRLTAWFSLVFLITSLLLFGLTMLNLYRTLQNDDRQALQTRVLGHWARFQAAVSEPAGINGLINDIQTETMVVGDRPYFVRIATADNRDVFIRIPLVEWQYAFDLQSLLDSPTPHSAGFITLSSDVLGYDLEIIGYPLSETYVLQIGMGTETRIRVLRIFRTSFLFTFAILFGISVLGGLFFTSRSLRPLGSLNATIKSIIATGELGQRISTSGGGDDLDDMVASFNHMLDRVEQLVTGMRESLDAVAHDLRTPMTRFRVNAERALARPGDSGVPGDPATHRDAVEALGSALEESDQILRMLNSIMDISEADAGAMSLKYEQVDLARLMTEVAEVYGVVAEEADIPINLNLEERVVVGADPGRMRQVVGNLVDNAVKYARPGSAVSITLTRQAGNARICVHNEGRGIPPAEIPHIWTRLYRGSDGKRSAGLGLGLTLVRAIVEAHGGRVEVESQPGEFAEFRIYIPLG